MNKHTSMWQQVVGAGIGYAHENHKEQSSFIRDVGSGIHFGRFAMVSSGSNQCSLLRLLGLGLRVNHVKNRVYVYGRWYRAESFDPRWYRTDAFPWGWWFEWHYKRTECWSTQCGDILLSATDHDGLVHLPVVMMSGNGTLNDSY